MKRVVEVELPYLTALVLLGGFWSFALPNCRNSLIKLQKTPVNHSMVISTKQSLRSFGDEHFVFGNWRNEQRGIDQKKVTFLIIIEKALFISISAQDKKKGNFWNEQKLQQCQTIQVDHQSNHGIATFLHSWFVSNIFLLLYSHEHQSVCFWINIYGWRVTNLRPWPD